MFERFTERARRVIYFANSEASKLGSTTIETEHLLLGLLREDWNITNRFLQHPFPVGHIRKEVEWRSTTKEASPSSDKNGWTSHGKGTTFSDGTISHPLSVECKRILALATEEANLLNHQYIGTQHLMLGLLRESNSVVAEILARLRFGRSTVRKQLQASNENA
jgi:ATP-dependent Clp protease ATP-binding subunit ClpC